MSGSQDAVAVAGGRAWRNGAVEKRSDVSGGSRSDTCPPTQYETRRDEEKGSEEYRVEAGRARVRNENGSISRPALRLATRPFCPPHRARTRDARRAEKGSARRTAARRFATLNVDPVDPRLEVSSGAPWMVVIIESGKTDVGESCVDLVVVVVLSWTGQANGALHVDTVAGVHPTAATDRRDSKKFNEIDDKKNLQDAK
ncbi:hypothetical protein IWZ03DRAFT_363637 [Phyllosticta citriasiana]|uniref:Uncharacterized protein n=1 Tax=Phyllosticta citriasiana TaxID=595635 RepID=A0ABR1K8T5_9PEZI